MPAGTEAQRNLDRLRASPEIAALRARAPDLVAWLFVRLERMTVRDAKQQRDAMLRRLADRISVRPMERATMLEDFLQRHRLGKLPKSEIADEIGSIFALGVKVPRSARQLHRLLTKSR